MQAHMAMPLIGPFRLLDVKVRRRNQQALKIVSFDCCPPVPLDPRKSRFSTELRFELCESLRLTMGELTSL